MMFFPHGLYETLVTEALSARLASRPQDRRVQADNLRTAEAADRIAWHIASVVERAIWPITFGELRGNSVETD